MLGLGSHVFSYYLGEFIFVFFFISGKLGTRGNILVYNQDMKISIGTLCMLFWLTTYHLGYVGVDVPHDYNTQVLSGAFIDHMEEFGNSSISVKASSRSLLLLVASDDQV